MWKNTNQVRYLPDILIKSRENICCPPTNRVECTAPFSSPDASTKANIGYGVRLRNACTVESDLKN